MAGIRIALAFISVNFTAHAGQQKGLDLAHQLADRETRNAAITELRISGEDKTPLLLAWAENAPSGIDAYQLDIGLADAFGALKAENAIPFLISQIGLNEFPYTNVWTRTPEAVLERLSAVRALIQIGPVASRAVMEAYPKYTTGHERLAAIFVVSHIRGVPEARQLLSATLGQAKTEQV